MAYTDIIDRTDASPLIPEEVSREIIKTVADSNALFQLARRLPDMSRKQNRMPVASALATAYFVNGDTGLKRTTELAWKNKYIEAEELAVVVPIPNAVLDDSDYDIWGEVKPALVEAFNVAIVQAVLYGTNIPASWTTNLGAAGLVALCNATGRVADVGDFADLYEAIMGESTKGAADGLLMQLETQGFNYTGHIAHITMKGRLRNTRDANGQPLFNENRSGGPAAAGNAVGELAGAPLYFPNDGSIDPDEALMITGDWRQLVYAIRQDISYTIATEGVITNAAGEIVYNLFQQDMCALRAVMRLGFALPNPIRRMAQNDATRCPFAILVETGS